MEAATPLRPTRVHALVGRLIVENVVVDDPVAADLVGRAIEAGEDPARVVADAVEIGARGLDREQAGPSGGGVGAGPPKAPREGEGGARVLDREQAGSSVEVLRADLEKASREVEERLGATSEQVVTELRTRLEEAFGPDQGHVTRVLQRHFGADSSTAVQHQVKAAVGELLNESRERLVRQVSSPQGANPLATLPRHAVAALPPSSDQPPPPP